MLGLNVIYSHYNKPKKDIKTQHSHVLYAANNIHSKKLGFFDNMKTNKSETGMWRY